MKKLLNEEQEKYVLENYQTMKFSDIEKELGCKPGYIGVFLRNKGIHKGKAHIFSESDKDYIKANYLTMTYKEIGDKLGFKERQIRGYVNNNLDRKVRTFNNDYFDNIDTKEKAYFLGLIYADGWIHINEECRNYEFGMQLQAQDKYILDALNQALGGSHLISFRKGRINRIGDQILHGGDSYTLRVFSKPLVMGLMVNGIETHKTYKKIIPHVSDELFLDFVRGYLDGDGWFTTNTRGNIEAGIVCCNREPVEYIRDRLKDFGVSGRVYTELEKKHSLHIYRKNDVIKFVNLIYQDKNCLCLKRKYNKVKHLIGLAA